MAKIVHNLRYFYDEIFEMREGCLKLQKGCEDNENTNKWFYLEGRVNVANDMLSIIAKEMEE